MSEERNATCGKCGQPMRFNVPRLGAFGGFVHRDSGELLCPRFPEGPITGEAVAYIAMANGVPMEYFTDERGCLRQRTSVPVTACVKDGVIHLAIGR